MDWARITLPIPTDAFSVHQEQSEEKRTSMYEKEFLKLLPSVEHRCGGRWTHTTSTWEPDQTVRLRQCHQSRSVDESAIAYLAAAWRPLQASFIV